MDEKERGLRKRRDGGVGRVVEGRDEGWRRRGTVWGREGYREKR